MSRRKIQYDDYRVAVQQVLNHYQSSLCEEFIANEAPQIIISSSDNDYLDQLIPALKDATNSNRTAGLVQSLSQYADEREADIERIGMTRHGDFLDSVKQLEGVRKSTVALTAEILDLNQSIQA